MKCLISIIILSVFVGLSNDAANATESLEDWTFYVWQGNITMTPSATVVNVQTPGSDLEE
ncbi:hypothetical protein N9219_05240 [bacterium]|nr:hypothetical protein [bacterium]